LEFLFNDLSLHGQYVEISQFVNAVTNLMLIRNLSSQNGHQLYCHRNFINAQVNSECHLSSAIKHLSPPQRSAFMTWIGNHGPFWEEIRNHSDSDYIEVNGDIVTDSAIGEVTFNIAHGNEQKLVSLSPSNWTYSPLEAHFHKESDLTNSIHVDNFYELETFKQALTTFSPTITSWLDFENYARNTFTCLYFTNDSFESLRRLPFSKACMDRIIERLRVLDTLKDSHNNNNNEKIKETTDNFLKQGNLFSDSSDTEKRNFESKLTFKHPENANKTLFCPWHGKMRMGSIRIRLHFSWPICAESTLYIVHLGEKLTKL